MSNTKASNLEETFICIHKKESINTLMEILTDVGDLTIV